MKMTEFRSRQPLNDGDFAAIRANVLATIAARNERRLLPIVMRFAVAAAVVIAVGSAFFVRRAAPIAVTTKAPVPAIVTSHATPPPPIVVAVTTKPPEAPVALRPRHRRLPHSEGVTTVASHQNIRMEFQTSDPDVRIIWIASQTPTTTGGKS